MDQAFFVLQVEVPAILGPEEASLQEARGDEPGALFKSRRGIRLAARDVRRICHRLSIEACMDIRPSRRFLLNPHRLRHMFLQEMAERHGMFVAQLVSGNISRQAILRYRPPSPEEVNRWVRESYR